MTITYGVPIVNLPFLYINGLGISNDGTTPNTLLDVAVGQCRDSTNVFDIALNSSIQISTAFSGINGLDTGSITASTVYAIYVIADSLNVNVPAGLLSLSLTTPTLPGGYNIFRLIGFCTIDSSSHILKGYWVGASNTRSFVFDAPQATAITAGTATTYTAVNLSTLVPAIQNLPVYMQATLTPNAANDTLKLTPTGATGDAVTINGQVASVAIYQNVYVFAKLAGSLPEVSYKVSTASASAALTVAGYIFSS